MHTHAHTRSPYSSSLCDEGRLEKKRKERKGEGGKGKKEKVWRKKRIDENVSIIGHIH